VTEHTTLLSTTKSIPSTSFETTVPIYVSEQRVGSTTRDESQRSVPYGTGSTTNDEHTVLEGTTSSAASTTPAVTISTHRSELVPTSRVPNIETESTSAVTLSEVSVSSTTQFQTEQSTQFSMTANLPTGMSTSEKTQNSVPDTSSTTLTKENTEMPVTASSEASIIWDDTTSTSQMEKVSTSHAAGRATESTSAVTLSEVSLSTSADFSTTEQLSGIDRVPTDCSNDCSKMPMREVCGSDAHSYGNECLLKAENCK